MVALQGFVDVGAAAPRWRMYAEAAASGSGAVVELHGAGLRLGAALGGDQERQGRRGHRLVGASQRGWLDGMSGRRPWAWCGGRGLRAVILCSPGYRQLCRAALQLELERWYVGVAAPAHSVII